MEMTPVFIKGDTDTALDISQPQRVIGCFHKIKQFRLERFSAWKEKNLPLGAIIRFIIPGHEDVGISVWYQFGDVRRQCSFWRI